MTHAYADYNFPLKTVNHFDTTRNFFVLRYLI